MAVYHTRAPPPPPASPRLASSRHVTTRRGLSETSVLSALKYDRFQNSFVLMELICARFRWTSCLLRCMYKGEVAPLLQTPDNKTIRPQPPPSFLLDVAAIVDPIPSASETPPLHFLYGRGAIRFLGSVSYATARQSSSSTSSTSTTSSSPSSSP